MRFGDCISHFAKYVILIFNSLMGLCGIALIVIGIIYMMFYEKNGLNVFWEYFSMGAVSIGVGAIMFLIAGFGCCGALHQNNCLLTIYAVFLVLLLLVQLALGLIAILKIRDYNSYYNLVKGLLQEMFGSKDTTKVNAFYDIQHQFSCCGVVGTQDYNTSYFYPVSCCPKLANPCFQDTTYTVGCTSAFADATKLYILLMGCFAIGFAGVQLLGIFFAYLVRRENNKNDFKFAEDGETSI